MPQYEYKFLTIRHNDKVLPDEIVELNELGRDGWRVVATFGPENSTGDAMYPRKGEGLYPPPSEKQARVIFNSMDITYYYVTLFLMERVSVA